MPNVCIANSRKTYKLRHLILLFHIHKICGHYFEILMVHYRNILCLMQHNLDIANIYSYSWLVQNGIPIHNVFFLFKMHWVSTCQWLQEDQLWPQLRSFLSSQAEMLFSSLDILKRVLWVFVQHIMFVVEYKFLWIFSIHWTCSKVVLFHEHLRDFMESKFSKVFFLQVSLPSFESSTLELVLFANWEQSPLLVLHFRDIFKGFLKWPSPLKKIEFLSSWHMSELHLVFRNWVMSFPGQLKR